MNNEDQTVFVICNIFYYGYAFSFGKDFVTNMISACFGFCNV